MGRDPSYRGQRFSLSIMTRLLDRDALGEVARFVYITGARHGDVMGKGTRRRRKGWKVEWPADPPAGVLRDGTGVGPVPRRWSGRASAFGRICLGCRAGSNDNSVEANDKR